MVRSWLSLLLLLGLFSPVSAAFLDRETLSLPMNSRDEVKTSLPLEDYKDYRVRVKSPYDLRPLWGVAPGTGHRYLLLFDGQFQDQDRMISTWNYADDMTELVWRWRGKGLQLTLRTATDLTAVIRHATVEISRVKVAGAPAEAPVTDATPPLWKQAPASGNFLERERMALRTDGAAIHTTRPLEPYRLYAVKIHSPYNLSPLLGALQFDGGDARDTRRVKTPGGEYRAVGIGVRISRQGHAAHPTPVAEYVRCRAPCSGGHHARRRWNAHGGSCSGLPHHCRGAARSLTSNRAPGGRRHWCRDLCWQSSMVCAVFGATVRTKPWHVSAPSNRL